MSITLGPFSFTAALLTTLIALLLGSAVGNRLAAQRGISVERGQWIVIVMAIFAARAAFVARYWQHYQAEPLRMFDIRDGGFTPLAGLGVAVMIAILLAWRDPIRRRAIAAGVGTGLAIWLLGTGLTSLVAPVDQRLPSLVLTDLNGRPVPLAAFAGKPLVVNLWASWCSPCRREMPALLRAQQQNPDITFVFANQRESAADIRQYLQTEQMSLRNVVLDPLGKLARATSSSGLPTTLFFDSSGAMVDKRMGELSTATLAQRLAAVRTSTLTKSVEFTISR